MNRISTTYASTSSSSSYSSSPFSRSNLDRDLVAQRTLLGENAYVDELDTPSPIATPSPMIKQLSPLSQATHLNAVENPFLDNIMSADYHYERDADETAADRWPIPITASVAAPPKQHTRQAQHHRSHQRSSFMTSSGQGLEDAQPITARQAPRTVESSSSPAHLATIQETATRVSPPVPPRRRAKPITNMTLYTLPPSTDYASPNLSAPTWRRPSVFPLGPVPPPLPPRRIRTEPQPHIVDIAVEKFKINTHTLSYHPSTSTPSPLTPVSSKSAQQEERERQWEKWETERVRAQQMTNEAAKNNRVFAPRSNASSSSAGSRITTTTVVVSEKVKPAPTPARSAKKTKKRSWWCFGGGAVESDAEEEADEKSQYSRERESRQRSVASLDAIEVDEEEEEEDESSDARASSHGTGLLRFSCSKSSSSRKGATLKKKTQ